MSSHSVIEPEIVAEVTDEDFKELGIQGRQGNIKQNTTHQGYQQSR
jgi:hypothetical protein